MLKQTMMFFEVRSSTLVAFFSKLVAALLVLNNQQSKFFFVSSLPHLPWSWDTVPLWADFDIRDWRTPWFTLEQAQFMGETYAILSLEKCLGGSLWYDDAELEGEEAFYELATAIRNYTTSNDTKILFYWNIDILYGDCYNYTKWILEDNETYSLMFNTDDDGDYYFATLETRPYLNQSSSFVREWWITTAIKIIEEGINNRNITIDGIFMDGMCTWQRYKGSGVSSSRHDALMDGNLQLLKEARDAFKSAFGDDFILLGNGLFSYTIWDNNSR